MKIIVKKNFFIIAIAFAWHTPVTPMKRIKSVGIAFKSSIQAIIASKSNIAEEQLKQLISTLPVELQTLILMEIIEQELRLPWTQKELQDKLDKFFLVYLPAQLEIKDEKGKVTEKIGYLLTQEQIKTYLRKLDDKVIDIIKKTWQMPITFLIKVFYNGDDRDKILAVINNKKFSSKKKEKLLSTQYKQQINKLKREVLSYRSTIPYIIKTAPDTGGAIHFNSKGIYSLAGLNEWQNPEKVSSIHLQKNDLTTIPANIFSIFTNLNSLYLGNNQLKNISPQAFNGLAQLYLLHIENNKLDDSLNVEAFKNLPSLAILNLRGNQFSDEKKKEIKDTLPDVTVTFE